MSRAISLVVATFVLFLFYGFDIDSKIQQSDERIAVLQSAMGEHTQQQEQLGEVIKHLSSVAEQSALPTRKTEILTATTQLEQHQQAIKDVYQQYAKEVDDYNLMISKFPGHLFSAMKGYQLKPTNTEKVLPSSAGVDFNNLTIPNSTPAQ